LTDIYDRATEAEEQSREKAIADQVRRSGLAGKTVADSATVCAVCDDLIPQDRREAVPGVQTCIHCQIELERASERNNRA
jgi:phage/conjugal plasmid C-4 type zinc finger TraR family protein